MPVDLSIIIVNYNTKELALDCIESIKKNTTNLNYEIILVENSTHDPIIKLPQVRIIRNKTNLGFTGANNKGMKEAAGKYILLLNSDTLMHDNVLREITDWMYENPQIGISTCALKNSDGSLQATGGYFPILVRVFSWMTIQDLPFIDNFIRPFHPKLYFYKGKRELDWVTGAFLFIRKEVVDQIGYLDEEYFMYTEDTDFCYRAKQKGWKIFYNPKWNITHFGGASSKKEYPILSEFKNIKLFYRKHYPKWQYSILRFLLKLGSLWRIVLVSPEIYGKAFKEV